MRLFSHHLGLALLLLSAAMLLASPPANDFNGDGRSDILWRNPDSGQVLQTLMQGSAVSPGTVVFTDTDPDWTIAGTADFDGDGKADILRWNALTGEVELILLDGPAIKSRSVIYREADTSWRIQAVGSFSGAGTASILWRNGWTGEIYLMPTKGGAVLPGKVIYTENRAEWQIVGAGDFNGDGRDDLLWWNRNSGAVVVMLLGADGVASQSQVYGEPDSRWLICGVGDFDGDGKADILWRNQTTGAVFLMLMDGFTIKASGLIYTEADLNWQIMAIGDYDGDGRADILWHNQATGAAYEMLMNGLTIRAQGFLDTRLSAAWAPAAAGKPIISQFTGLSGILAYGDPCLLTATFSGGTGLITPGGIPISSGGTVTLTATGVQVYTLTVTSPGGQVTTASYSPLNNVVLVTAAGAGPRPASLGSYLMTPFNPDPRSIPLYVGSVRSPLGGSLGFSPTLDHHRIGQGWATWDNGYTGDVYVTWSSVGGVTLTLPPGTDAFYFYVEPEQFGQFLIKASGDDGSYASAIVEGKGGASFFGIYCRRPGSALVAITITAPAAARGFALGEFAIHQPSRPEA